MSQLGIDEKTTTEATRKLIEKLHEKLIINKVSQASRLSETDLLALKCVARILFKGEY